MSPVHLHGPVERPRELVLPGPLIFLLRGHLWRPHQVAVSMVPNPSRSAGPLLHSLPLALALLGRLEPHRGLGRGLTGCCRTVCLRLLVGRGEACCVFKGTVGSEDVRRQPIGRVQDLSALGEAYERVAAVGGREFEHVGALQKQGLQAHRLLDTLILAIFLQVGPTGAHVVGAVGGVVQCRHKCPTSRLSLKMRPNGRVECIFKRPHCRVLRSCPWHTQPWP
mmetsp:Transcript_79968/g.172849  ORF Transcript_79968/g.172849 Transcript_79968/m.172849 type:complete len:223 (+) Transcript_79968:708-1376(+)